MQGKGTSNASVSKLNRPPTVLKPIVSAALLIPSKETPSRFNEQTVLIESILKSRP